MKKILNILTVITILFVTSLSSIVTARTGTEKTPFDGVVVAESCGSCNGEICYNSKQALEESIASGYKTIEIDMALTLDEELVCIKNWEKSTLKKMEFDFNENATMMTYDEFMSAKINTVYNTMDAKEFNAYVEKYGDIRWVVDFGDLSGWDVLNTMRKFVSAFEYYADRVTMKIYNMGDMYKRIGSFPNLIYVIDSKEDVEDIDNILTFCSDKNFMAIQVKNSLITKDIVDKCHEYGLQVVSTTTNSEKKAKKLLDLGVDCIATNTISPDFGEVTEK